MTKVLRIITRLNIGGPAIHTILLSSSFNSLDNFKDILLTGSVSENEGDMIYFAQQKGIKPVFISDMTREISLRSDLKSALQIYRIIKNEKPDIVHTHTAKAGTLGRIAAILAGVPIKIHTFHGHVFDGYFNFYKTKLFIYIERFLALFTDKIIVVSDEIRKDIVEKLKITDSSKGVIVKLGLELDKFLDCEKYAGSFRKKMGFAGDTRLVGIVGRLVPVKNHKMFLKAVKIVSDTMPELNVKFLVIGDGELRKILYDYAVSLGIADKVIFTGWIEDLASVYADLDLVALTSLNEGTPVSIIEAMASAKPVLSTAVGGVSDLVSEGKNGFLVKAGDEVSFAGKMLTLLKNDIIRGEMGSHGRNYVRHAYSKNRLVNDIQNLYEKCLAEKMPAK